MQTNRRTFLLGSTAMLVAGCTGRPKSAEMCLYSFSSDVFNDAHVHLFNASDVPIVGFIKYVLMPMFKIDTGEGGLLDCMVDIALNILNRFAPTIADERRKLGMTRSDEAFESASFEEITEAQFSDEISRLINYRLAPGEASEFEALGAQADYESDASPEDLQKSHGKLAAMLVSYAQGDEREDDAGYESIFAYEPPDSVDAGTVLFALEQPAAENTFERIDASEITIKKAVHTLRWSFQMLRYRYKHVGTFYDKIGSAEQRPKHIINLLVDYEYWMRGTSGDFNQADGPSDGSEQAAQIEFWHDYSRAGKASFGIHTFAGYDPLRHAYELQTNPGEPSAYFERLKALYAEGKLAGLKLYPPMGFRMYDNASLADEDYIGSDGVKGKILDWWKSAVTSGAALGEALDAALDVLYTFAEAEDMPLLAHSGSTNVIAKNFADRSNPRYLARALEVYPNLRVCIGHFTDAEYFRNAMKFNPPRCEYVDVATGRPTFKKEGRYNWAVCEARDLLIKYPNVYADIGYMEELLPQASHSVDAEIFFADFFEYCRVDGGEALLSKFMFGSDWIMLGGEVNFEQYANAIRCGLIKAMRKTLAIDTAGFEDRFFVSNFEKFLQLG